MTIMNSTLFNSVGLLKQSASLKFHAATKLTEFNHKKRAKKSHVPQEWKTIYYKAYPRFPQVILPKPTPIHASLNSVLFNRQSFRNFSKRPVGLQTISNLLYYSAGIKKLTSKVDTNKRFYPSAGARYPLEVYLCALNITGITEGIYHYHVKTNTLELLKRPPFKKILFKQFDQPWMIKAGFLLIVTAMFERTQNKYKDRGYRHIVTEYGHLAQNVYLLSSALNIGSCSIGGFIDDGINNILDVDTQEEQVVGVLVGGTNV